MRRNMTMARTKSITSIDSEISKITSELTKLQEKQDTLSDRLLKLQKQKKDNEAKQVMEAFQKSGRTLQELMTFLDA